ncbi:MAG: hypothetical protein HS108_00575 [Planctomycetes bacterium]|jgi:antitoxin component YwqK of YwqJK toxin-antitoxin module|nr:hypothetical protein [Planctomycetota bacterium]MCL4731582.1 hypothetical protein [Planctomycetota bacterium]
MPNAAVDVEYWESVRVAGILVWHGQVKSRHQYLTDADGQPKYEHNGVLYPGKIPDGWCYAWHRNGQLRRRELWHDGQSRYTRNTIFVEAFDDRGNLTRRIVGGSAGTDTTWYPSGRPHIHIEMTYNDTPHGETIEWDESGNIISRKTYEHGVLIRESPSSDSTTETK